MSMKPQHIPAVPEETDRVVRDELGSLYTDEIFQDLYPADGQPSLSLELEDAGFHKLCVMAAYANLVTLARSKRICRTLLSLLLPIFCVLFIG